MIFAFPMLCLLGIFVPPIALIFIRSNLKAESILLAKHEPAFPKVDVDTVSSTEDAAAANNPPKDSMGLYARLGVEPTARTEEIKVAYRNQAKLFHPDINPAGDANAEWLRELNEAYQVLSDPEQRLAYDMSQITRASAVVPAPPHAPGIAPATPDASMTGSAMSKPEPPSSRGRTYALASLGLIGAIAIGVFVGIRLNFPSDAKSSSASPPSHLCIAPVQGPAEVLSTVPTVQLSTYIDGLRSGRYAFNYGLDGMTAASQLGFSRRFAVAYGEVVERTGRVIAAKGSADINEIIAFFDSILPEEKVIDDLVKQRGKPFTATIFLRALQDGYCAFPNVYADNVPPADAVLAELTRTFPRIPISATDGFFADLYTKQLGRERDEARQPGGYSFWKTIMVLRHEIAAASR
jgi:hypothetical protein